jgi:hypothetical protein
MNYDEAICALADLEAVLLNEDDTERISAERLRVLAEAEKDGRVPICPVKLHQHIFRVFHGEIYEEVVCGAAYEPFTPRPRWKIWTMGGGLPYYWRDVFGKTVFITRAEAEAALNPGESS